MKKMILRGKLCHFEEKKSDFLGENVNLMGKAHFEGKKKSTFTFLFGETNQILRGKLLT